MQAPPPVAVFELDLTAGRVRRLLLGLSSINVIFGLTTAAFIVVWERLDRYSESARALIKYGLVQGHLATENVVAAWYSSMLLLSVALAGVMAFDLDRTRRASAIHYGWLIVAAAFLILSLDEIGSLHERIGMMRSLSTSTDRAVGWVYVLAVPIAVVGLFLLTFAWLHVRTVRRAFRWMAAGVALFLANPVFEAVEMRLIHGVGAQAGTWQRMLHDVLLVLEEGVLELFGIVCFLIGILTYASAVAGGSALFSVDTGKTRSIVRGITCLAVVGVFSAAAIVERLPEGDSGIPSNWFPAALFFAVALASSGRLALLAIVASAVCGAGLYGYSRMLFYGGPPVAALATVIAGWMLEAVLTSPRDTRSGAPATLSRDGGGREARWTSSG